MWQPRLLCGIRAPRAAASHGSAGDAITTPGLPRVETNKAPDPAALSQLLVAVGTSQDRSAFAELFRHFAPRLKGYLQRIGGDMAAAEESMQEAMVLVWRKAGQFDPAKANASTWIFTIARNARIDSFRRDRRPELDPDDPALVPDAEEQPDVALAKGQSAVKLKEAMENLSEAEQSVLHLSFFEDLSHSIIAKQLGIPLGTVKSRLRLAFGKLRGVLSELEATT
jgi:RNA polymerase sigma-70 factor (ECF subfamily)